MPKISVIIPIYNAEEYINRCIDSVLNQTFTDFECILIDDGSPDRCAQICDEYAKKDNRIKVIHKLNGGQAEARNIGIDNALGEYINYIDSDDWIHPQMLEILYNGIVMNNVTLSVCSYEETKIYTKSNIITKYNFETIKGMDFLVEHNVNAVVPWAKLYHRSLFDGIRYPVGRIYEDTFTTYKLLYKAGDIAFCDKKMYKYFVNKNGTTKSYFSTKRIEDIMCALEECDKFIKEHNLVDYKRWSKEQLLKLYNWTYPVAKEMGYKKCKNRILRKLRWLLLFDGKKLGAGISTTPWYFETAFPKTMQVVELFGILNRNYRKYGIKECFRKAVSKLKEK